MEVRDHLVLSTRLADRLRFDLTSDLGYRYPGAEDAEAMCKLGELCQGRLQDRYAEAAADFPEWLAHPRVIPRAVYRARPVRCRRLQAAARLLSAAARHFQAARQSGPSC